MKNFRWCTNIDRRIEQLDLVVFLAKRAVCPWNERSLGIRRVEYGRIQQCSAASNVNSNLHLETHRRRRSSGWGDK